MIFKLQKNICVGVLATFSFHPLGALAYKEPTHMEISKAATSSSDLSKMSKLNDMGLASNGYEVQTHRDMSRASANYSVLVIPSALEQLGLKGAGLYDNSEKFPNSDTFLGFGISKSMTIGELIQFGAGFEDERRKVQALYHFFNPVNGQGLIVGGSVLTGATKCFSCIS